MIDTCSVKKLQAAQHLILLPMENCGSKDREANYPDRNPWGFR